MKTEQCVLHKSFSCVYLTSFRSEYRGWTLKRVLCLQRGA